MLRLLYVTVGLVVLKALLNLDDVGNLLQEEAVDIGHVVDGINRESLPECVKEASETLIRRILKEHRNLLLGGVHRDIGIEGAACLHERLLKGASD